MFRWRARGVAHLEYSSEYVECVWLVRKGGLLLGVIYLEKLTFSHRRAFHNLVSHQ